MAHPVITITRQYASGGAAVARQVAAALAWTVIDNEFVDEVARRAGLAPAMVAEHEERAPRRRGEGGGRHGPPARPVRADLLRAAPPRRRELRPRGQHGAAGHRRRGGPGRGRGKAAAVGVTEQVT